MSGLAKVGRLLAGYRRGDATFTGVSCQELQRTHLNIFNSGFLHHRDFRFPPGPTEPVFWESAILESQLSLHHGTYQLTIPNSSLETGYLDTGTDFENHPAKSWIFFVWLLRWTVVYAPLACPSDFLNRIYGIVRKFWFDIGSGKWGEFISRLN